MTEVDTVVGYSRGRFCCEGNDLTASRATFWTKDVTIVLDPAINDPPCTNLPRLYSLEAGLSVDPRHLRGMVQFVLVRRATPSHG